MVAWIHKKYFSIINMRINILHVTFHDGNILSCVVIPSILQIENIREDVSLDKVLDAERYALIL